MTKKRLALSGLLSAFGLVIVLIVVTPTAAGVKPGTSAFALFDATDPASVQVGVECGLVDSPFTYFVTVSIWSSETKVLRVLYADETFARYPILPGTSFSFSQAAGSAAGIDDLIRVFAEGPYPTGVAGSVSLLSAAAASPHPSLPTPCRTLTAVL